MKPNSCYTSEVEITHHLVLQITLPRYREFYDDDYDDDNDNDNKSLSHTESYDLSNDTQ